MTPRLIQSHYEINYGGVVQRLNAIDKELAAIDPTTTSPEIIHRLKRDEAAALNSMLLHELYFASLGGDGRAVPETMAGALAQDFGSVTRWRDEFIALATGLARAGSTGWALLTYVPRDRRLVNQLATDDSQAISGAIPILALDMYEHAYHIDFGGNASAYIASFMRNIEWNVVQTRYNNATKVDPPPRLFQPQFGDVPAVTAEEVEALVASGAAVQILDVRPRHYATRPRTS
jgi:Fe-Mn family superoxide dismutase